MNFSKRLNAVIPGGAHTYSRGDDQFPSNAPDLLVKGKGAYVWGPEGDQYLDYGMGLRSVNIGYADEAVNAAVFDAIGLGNNLTRASMIELEAAERFVELIDSADMVKFAKNGSNVTTAAIKLSRAFTGKKKVMRCRQHPFFSFDDWFIGTTPMNSGVPDDHRDDTILFDYNDIDNVQLIIDQNYGEIACIILEPATDTCPKYNQSDTDCCGTSPCSRKSALRVPANFLNHLRDICDKNNILLIFDEMITGFRWDIGGAQKIFGVVPDLSTFGKAMANGFSVAALAGKKDIMNLGSTDIDGMERLFLLSSTHGAEMNSLAAFLATTTVIEERSVTDHLWDYGNKFTKMFNDISRGEKMIDHIFAKGPVVSPGYATLDNNHENSLRLRTKFNQEMVNQGVLMPWISFSLAHDTEEMQITGEALQIAIRKCKAALEGGLSETTLPRIQKPVFRRYN